MGGKQSFLRKTVDPLGLTGGKAGWEKGYWGDGGGGGKKKKGGGSGGGGAAPDPMMQYLSQMQSAQAAQAEASRRAQEEAMLEAQRRSAEASARQGEMGAQQFLSQAGSMQQARDIAALQGQQQAAAAAGQSAVGGGFDIAKAREEQAANLSGTGAIPTTSRLPFYGMDTANADVGTTGRLANIFNLPKATGLTFGGQ